MPIVAREPFVSREKRIQEANVRYMEENAKAWNSLTEAEKILIMEIAEKEEDKEE